MIPNAIYRNKESFLDENSGLDLYEEILWFLSFQNQENDQFVIQRLKEKKNQDLCKSFLDDVDRVLDSGDQEQITEFFDNFSQIFNIKNSINRSKRILIIDQVIDKLISILTKIDIFSQTYICIVIISCLGKIFKIYRIFDKIETINLLNSFIVHSFDNCPSKEMLYSLLIFTNSYYIYFNNYVFPIIDKCILPKLIENDSLLFQFLPTKENEMQQKNPIILIYISFIRYEIIRSPDFSDRIQIIFDFLSKYIAECQELIIPIEMDESMDDYNYVDISSEHIAVFNKKIENHIFVSMQPYLIAISHLGGKFFDLYNHQKFPSDFLYFIFYDHDAKISSINFYHICCLQKIDLKPFLDHNIYCSLVRLLSNSTFRTKAIDIIDSLIKINNSLISNFIDANIEETNIFIEINMTRESYKNVLNYMKLAQTIIHFYPPSPYKFGICEFIKYCIKILENGGSELPSIIFQIFFDMYNHLLKLEESQLSLFESQFLASDGNEITQEYIEDEFDNSEVCEYAQSFLTLFQSNCSGKKGFDIE